MNTLLIQQNLIKHLQSFGNSYENGQSIYSIKSVVHQSNDDESAICSIIFTGNYKEDEEETEGEVYNKILAINPNEILETDDLESFNKLEIPDQVSTTGVQPILWLTKYNDSFTIHATDHSIYMTFIQSGQY